MIPLYVFAAFAAATALVVLFRYLVRRLRDYRRISHLARQRMQLLRRLLTLAYVFGSNPALFLKKFREEVDIRRLESCDVLCNYQDQRQLESRKADGHTLNRQDMLLCILLEKGFTPQELSVMYGMKNHNSIYVRHARIRKKSRTEPEKQKSS